MATRARRHDGGSIRRLPSGKWQVRIRDKATRGMVSLGTFATKADANAALTVASADMQRGGFVSPDRGRVTLATYARDWLANHPRLAPGTRDLYRILLNRHILPGLGDAHLGDIEPATVERWYHRLGDTASAGQRAKAYKLLRAICNHAIKNNRIVRNPCMIDGGGKETTPERPVATIPQVFALAAAFPDRLAAIVPVAAFASLRVGEAAGLQRRDVDPLAGQVHVRRQLQRLSGGALIAKPPKADSQRSVALPDQVMDLLEKHMESYTGTKPDSPVFSRPHGTPIDHLYVGAAWRHARAEVAAADTTLPAGLHFHDLRGTGATLATAQGASLKEVMARLGHRTTRAALIYQYATADRDRAIAGLLGQAIDEAGAEVTHLDDRRARPRDDAEQHLTAINGALRSRPRDGSGRASL